MPTDEASRTVTVTAPIDTVLATIRAVDHEPDWVEEIRSVEVLSSDDDGLPLQAHLTAAATYALRSTRPSSRSVDVG